MFPSASLLTFLLTALSLSSPTSASPLLSSSPAKTLAFAAKVNVTGIASLVAHDQARARSLISHGNDLARQGVRPDVNVRRAASISATNAVVTYTSQVGIGANNVQYTLLIDTGSSNTWVGASKKYSTSSTSTNTGNKVSVSYGSGSFSGTEYIDKVTLSSALVIQKQSIGVASTATGFSGEDGILGVGPVLLTQGTVANTNTVPTVTDNLYTQGTISVDSLGVFYAPTTSSSVTNGELTFGGYDSSKITGSLNNVPLTSTSPASYYWGINQSVNYGGSTTILSSTAGIVDTGTTLVLLASDAFSRYKSATGAVADSATGLLRITSAQYSALKTLNFVINGVTYGLTPNAQIFPRSLNTAIGGSASSIYLIVADLGSNSGTGLDFINGYTFLERFYSYYDTTNKRMGFATTAYTSATTN